MIVAHSLIDHLAEQLSAATGSKITVQRLLDPDLDRIGRPKVGRYRLHISRGEYSFSSGDLKVSEAKALLALVLDWIQMRFLILEGQHSVIVSRRWIACSNAEWGCYPPGGSWERGGSLAGALQKAGRHVDGAKGGTVRVMPDDTAQQVRDARRAFFGED